MKAAITLRSLERLRDADPEALRHLADARVARAYAAAVLRDDPAAAAEFGDDPGAIARLGAVLRHDFARVPIGAPETRPESAETRPVAMNAPDPRTSGSTDDPEPVAARTVELRPEEPAAGRLSLDAAGKRLGLPFARLALMEAEPLATALRDAGLDPRRDGRVVTLDATKVERLAADRDAGCELALRLAGRVPSLCHFTAGGVALR